PAHCAAEDMNRAVASSEHSRGVEVVGEDGNVAPARDLLGESQRRGADVDTDRFAVADQPCRGARDCRFGASALPAPAGKGGLGAVENLAAADADGAAMGARDQALVLERPKVAADRHLRNREPFGDFGHQDEAVAVDELKNAGMPRTGWNPPEVDVGISHE